MTSNQQLHARKLSRMFGAASLLAIAAAAAPLAAHAQATDSSVETVVVTASRVTTGGFIAPTPTTVLGGEAILKTAPIQVSEALQLQPQFRVTSQSSAAAQFANLRNIGSTRTLVLVNGRRHVPTNSEGVFDLNNIPASLLERTETVTGGASASWGSDAVSGVVNLILNTRLEGIQGSVQYGESKYGDAVTYAGSVAGGTSFMQGRGHVVVGLDYVRDKGIQDLQPNDFSRPWAYESRGQISNPSPATNGLPGLIVTRGAVRADTSVGGLITTGPLRGQTFNTAGTGLRPFGYGQVFGANMIGGTDNIGETISPGSDVRYPFERYSLFTAAEYELSSNVTAFVEGSYAHALTKNSHTNALRFDAAVAGNTACTQTTAATNLGTIAVNINNAFLPASVRQQMTAAGVSCFGMGKTFRQPGVIDTIESKDGSPYVWRGVAGLKGTFGDGWNWNTYYQYGENRADQVRAGNLNMARFRQSIDAVVNPAGQIVCRSTLTNPTNGCVPTNLFGDNSVTPEAAAYILGTAKQVTHTKQQVAAFSIDGELIDLWAGPLSVATGVEYRKEEVVATVDPTSLIDGWQTGNRKPTAGSYDVKEIFGEVVLPLMRDKPLFQSLDLNGAVRYTDYSSSGGVTTWKLGATWDLTEDFRLRGTRSRDIRAGNLAELFTPSSTATNTALVRRDTGQSNPVLVETRGNPTLDPEKADTFTVGAIYQPSWASGLRLSIDYYDIAIKGAIGTLTAQQILDRCYLEKLTEFCGFVTTDTTGAISRVTNSQINLNRFDTSGVDMEIAYRMPLERISPSLPGTLNSRLLATYVTKLATTAAINGQVTDQAGLYTNPHWTVFGNFIYDLGRFSATLDMRFYGGGKISNDRTQGEIGLQGININHVGRTLYTNLAFDYELMNDRRLVLFARINNVTNKWPVFPSNSVFDEVGRAYRVGMRFKY